jgi:hypothetical protein
MHSLHSHHDDHRRRREEEERRSTAIVLDMPRRRRSTTSSTGLFLCILTMTTTDEEERRRSRAARPSCWICLEEEEVLPVRGSSGYAHLSCLIHNAEGRSKQAYEESPLSSCSHRDIATNFIVCPNCKQEYQDDIKSNMTYALLAFVERELRGTRYEILHVHALIHRIRVLLDDVHDAKRREEDKRMEGEEIISKLLSSIDKMKSCNHVHRIWQSGGFLKLEADVYFAIGHFNMAIDSQESLTSAKEYFVKVRDIDILIGNEANVMVMERNISIVDAELAVLGGNNNSKKKKKLEHDASSDLKSERQYTEYCLEKYGELDPRSITAVVHLADVLCNVHRTVEAERLLSKLVRSCRRVHGPDHGSTARVVSALQHVKERWVKVKDQKEGRFVLFQALRYEDDGTSCILQGPLVTHPRCVEGEEEQTLLRVASSDLILTEGTPVRLCCGLMKEQESHLHGQIGDVRVVFEDVRECEVHFEEEEADDLGHGVRVKAENLRIVFDLTGGSEYDNRSQYDGKQQGNDKGSYNDKGRDQDQEIKQQQQQQQQRIIQNGCTYYHGEKNTMQVPKWNGFMWFVVIAIGCIVLAAAMVLLEPSILQGPSKIRPRRET